VQDNNIHNLYHQAPRDPVMERALACASGRRWVAILGLMALGLVSASLCRAGNGPVTYAYDALGRLVAVVDGSGNAAVYTYDAAGNLVKIAPPTTAVSIFSFTPNNGPVGQSVTIYGDGFSTTASQNAVTFNGVAATATASTIATITTKVPTDATTGPIKVTVGGNSGTSTTNFKVTAN